MADALCFLLGMGTGTQTDTEKNQDLLAPTSQGCEEEMMGRFEVLSRGHGMWIVSTPYIKKLLILKNEVSSLRANHWSGGK